MRTIYHWRGDKSNEGMFEDGEYVGEHIEYYENGNIKKRGKYIKGVRVGEHITYYENGNVKEVEKNPEELSIFIKILLFLS